MKHEVTGNTLAGFVETGRDVLLIVAALALGFWFLNPMPRASAASFYPACLGKTCSLGQCTQDWAGGKPLTKRGMNACCRYGGTAYVSEGKIYCRGRR